MKKKCKRKVWARLNPIEHAMFQASKLTTAEWNEQMAPVITATEHPAHVGRKGAAIWCPA